MIFAKNERQIDSLVNTVLIFSIEYKWNLNLKKLRALPLKSDKWNCWQGQILEMARARRFESPCRSICCVLHKNRLFERTRATLAESYPITAPSRWPLFHSKLATFASSALFWCFGWTIYLVNSMKRAESVNVFQNQI